MVKLLGSTIGNTHGLSAGAKRGRFHLAAAGAVALLSAVPASAATPTKIANPAALPDLSVSLSAPSPVPAYAVSSFTVVVTDSAPSLTIASRTASDSVITHVDLTGMVAQYAEGPAGFSCQVSTGNATTPWSTVDCTGTIAWGSSATITVYFQPATDSAGSTNSCAASWYCGQPSYADASVSFWSGTADRSSANNRAVSRIDTTDCIG